MVKQLHELIIAINPEVSKKDFLDTIILQNDSDGKGDYIASWTHPTLSKPNKGQMISAGAVPSQVDEMLLKDANKGEKPG